MLNTPNRESWKYVRQFKTDLEQAQKKLELIDNRLVGNERLTSSKFVQLIEERNNLLYKCCSIRLKISRAQQSKNPWGERIELTTTCNLK
ncbi:MAG TPA: hypothetical protein VLH56_18160 [Dissulfurispiraceae bacterium]|nr:hypothetical protein [Dissulfurispiraceae bacterium]